MSIWTRKTTIYITMDAVMLLIGHCFIQCPTEQYSKKCIGKLTGKYQTFVSNEWLEVSNIVSKVLTTIHINTFLATRNVNEKFAAITLDALRRMLREKPKETPIVWIHDYHLMVAANTVRQVCYQFSNKR